MRCVLHLLPLVSLALLGVARPTLAAERPNVLFIAVDDLRPEIGAFGAGGMSTPHLDRLASRGTRFERAYCMVPTCGASRAALMTGVRPARGRFVTYFARADEDASGVVPLHSHFKDHGYTTVSLGKILHVAADSADGWSEPPWRPSAPAYATSEALARTGKDRKGRARGPSWEDGGEVPDNTYADGRLADHASEKLRELAAGETPFFLAVGFYKPHLPFVAPGRYFEPYPPGSVTMPDNYFPPANVPAAAMHASGELRSYTDIPPRGVLPEAKALELIRAYRAATSYTDAQIGRLLDAFDELGLAESTLVVLWGDHGWNLGEHTLWCKHSCFETSLLAPLLFAGPTGSGIRSGSVSRSLVEFIDVYPTLCELAGLPLPEHLRGVSLMPALRDPEVAVKEEAISRFGAGDSIRTERYRYSLYRDTQGRETGQMLYDHETDPGENVNVVDDPAHAETVAELRQRLEEGMGRPGEL